MHILLVDETIENIETFSAFRKLFGIKLNKEDRTIVYKAIYKLCEMTLSIKS